jgi:hypothetical protein
VTIRPRTIVRGLALGLGFLVALIFGHAAGATGQPGHRPAPCCTTAPEWYVNPDETALKPQQLPQSLLFDGPSLIHHAVTPIGLADAPTDGAFGGWLLHGVWPLFKLETTAPYSTLNKTTGGWWSSKIVSGAGSQSMPLASVAEFVGKWNYTAGTKVFSFGVGYANDGGNKALVTWISYGGHKHGLGCPSASPSPSASSPSPSLSPTPSLTPTLGSPTPTLPATLPATTSPPTPDTTTPAPKPTDTPGSTPTAIVAGAGGIGGPGSLAKTGYNLGIPLGVGVSAIVAGLLLAVVAWRRRRSFVA